MSLLQSEQNLSADIAQKVVSIASIRDLESLKAQIGSKSPAFIELDRFFELAEAYDFSNWLVLGQ